MKKIATMLVALTALALVSSSPAAARGTEGAPDATETRSDPSRPALTIKATGLLQRRGMTPYPYGTHRIFDASSMRFYALRSSRHPALLDRYVGERVVVYGTRVPGFPGGSGVPLLDVFRVVPLATLSPA